MAFRHVARLLGVAVSLAMIVGFAFPSTGASLARRSSERELTDDEEGKFEALEAADQWAEARTSPADTVDAGAFTAAYQQALNLPVVGGPWREVTTAPYQNDDHAYRDPVWSNSGAGWGLVTGRATSLAADGDALYVGMADGGVWKTTDGGDSWDPLLDDAPSLSIGAVAVDPADHSVWVGTGEANTSSDSYAGTGVLRTTDGGATWLRVGGTELENHLISRLAFDGEGNVYAATSMGLYRHAVGTNAGAWTLLLKPCVGQHDTTFISDVVIRPGAGGQDVIAVVGWRGGSACNGFYESTDGGDTFAPISLTGSINERQIGRTMLAYSANGEKLYAVVQSSSLFNHGTAHQAGTLLMGVFVSPHGNPAGSWTKIAEASTLAASGSALKGFRGYYPGVQAWYNEFLTVDPSNAKHVYLGLEEVFETRDGGVSWKAIGPYWNFGLRCTAGGLDNCPPTTHPDQHGVLVAGDRVYVANDGGVYSRPLDDSAGWSDHNGSLRSLQYYFSASGHTDGGEAYWGGLQDNGESLLSPGSSTMVSPFGGDGGDTLVDPADADRAVVEYTDLDMALTTNGGRSDGSTQSWTEISPSCFAFTYTPSPCDPLPRFIAPFDADVNDLDHWVAGGEYVWDNGGKGWDTRCSTKACDWTIVHDTGAGHSITAIADNGDVTYAGWCGPCNPPGFAAMIDTNYGGTWHTVSAPNLPNRFISAITVDPADAAHVFAVYNGFSRRWVQGGGVGHVFESTDGGETWTDVSGDLPDIPADDLLLVNGNLVLATDLGVYVAPEGDGESTAWSRLGTGLPKASTNDVSLTSDGDTVVAATHGRGLWSIPAPS